MVALHAVVAPKRIIGRQEKSRLFLTKEAEAFQEQPQPKIACRKDIIYVV